MAGILSDEFESCGKIAKYVYVQNMFPKKTDESTDLPHPPKKIESFFFLFFNSKFNEGTKKIAVKATNK